MSYATKYTVPFQSISGIDYVVLIDVDGFVGDSTELIGGGNVFTTEVDEDDVLTPLRSGSATLQVYGSDYLQDLYVSNPQGVRVKLMKGAEVMWLGYMTPDTFSQDFSRPEFLYDIECVIALSTLKHKKFTGITDTITFIQLIKNAAVLAGYSKIYLTKSVCGTLGENIYDTGSLICGNFYDELGEGMTYYEILEEIAKYLVCSTFTASGDALYLLDYQAIRNGINDYYYYDLTSNPPTTVTLVDVTSTQTLGYRGTGATLSRIAGKNKAAVNCSLYEVENVLPEFDDEQSVFVRMKELYQYYKDEKLDKISKGFIRHYNQPKFTFYKYQFLPNNGVLITPNSDQLGDSDIGSGFVRTASYLSYDGAKNLELKSSDLNFENEVLVRAWNVSPGDENIPRGTGPVFTMESEKTMIANANTWFSLSLNVKLIAMPNGSADYFQVYSKYKAPETINLHVPFKLTFGKYIYDSARGGEWLLMTPENMNTISNIVIKIEEGEIVYGKHHATPDTNIWTQGVDLSGYMISPLGSTEVGKFSLTLMRPFTFNVNSDGLTQYYYFKDIKLEYQQSDANAIYGDWVKEGTKNDVIYENVISDEYIEEADEVDLKICTYSDNKLALSSVLSGTGYMDNIQSLSLAKTDIAEKLILEKIVSTFDTPRFTINPTVKNALKPYSLVTDEGLSGVTFVNCGGETDWKMDSTTTNLIQL